MYRYWPWFLSEIDFDDLNNLPTTATVTDDDDICISISLDDYPNITGTFLDRKYLYGTTTILTRDRSPYYVVENVTIQLNATIYVENGVEIIFAYKYLMIDVIGIFSTCYDINIGSSSDPSLRGLINSTQYTHIHGMNSRKQGLFWYDYVYGGGSKGLFCNTLFSSLQHIGSSDYYKSNITLNNCEVADVDYPFVGDGDWSLIQNSYLHNFIAVIDKDEEWTFDNCLFTDFVSIVASTSYTIYIYNSEIIGNRSSSCILTSWYSEIINNTITNCDIGIYFSVFGGLIRYNNISNNNVGVILTSLDRDGIMQYNNFIDNEINVQLNTDGDFNNGKYNYWGVDTPDQTLISSKIDDICDGYSDGMSIVLYTILYSYYWSNFICFFILYPVCSSAFAIKNGCISMGS